MVNKVKCRPNETFTTRGSLVILAHKGISVIIWGFGYEAILDSELRVHKDIPDIWPA